MALKSKASLANEQKDKELQKNLEKVVRVSPRGRARQSVPQSLTRV